MIVDSILGLPFLFKVIENELSKAVGARNSRRTIGNADYQARGVMYLPEQARYSYLLQLPEGENIGRAVNDAVKAIEAENEELKDVLPKTYTLLFI